MPVDPLVELARPTAPAAAMGQGEVVEDEQVARSQRDLDLDGFHIQTETVEEAQLAGQIVELHPTEKTGRGLDARESRRAGRRLDNACQAALAIAAGVIPRPVRLAVRNQVLEKRRPIGGQRRWPRRASSGTNRVTAVTPTAESGMKSAVYRATS